MAGDPSYSTGCPGFASWLMTTPLRVSFNGEGAGDHGLLSVEQAQVEAVAIGDLLMHVRGNEGGALGSDVREAAGQLHVADVVGGGGRISPVAPSRI
jgi:hypothetical protein